MATGGTNDYGGDWVQAFVEGGIVPGYQASCHINKSDFEKIYKYMGRMIRVLDWLIIESGQVMDLRGTTDNVDILLHNSRKLRKRLNGGHIQNVTPTRQRRLQVVARVIDEDCGDVSKALTISRSIPSLVSTIRELLLFLVQTIPMADQDRDPEPGDAVEEVVRNNPHQESAPVYPGSTSSSRRSSSSATPSSSSSLSSISNIFRRSNRSSGTSLTTPEYPRDDPPGYPRDNPPDYYTRQDDTPQSTPLQRSSSSRTSISERIRNAGHRAIALAHDPFRRDSRQTPARASARGSMRNAGLNFPTESSSRSTFYVPVDQPTQSGSACNLPVNLPMPPGSPRNTIPMPDDPTGPTQDEVDTYIEAQHQQCPLPKYSYRPPRPPSYADSDVPEGYSTPLAGVTPEHSPENVVHTHIGIPPRLNEPPAPSIIRNLYDNEIPVPEAMRFPQRGMRAMVVSRNPDEPHIDEGMVGTVLDIGRRMLVTEPRVVEAGVARYTIAAVIEWEHDPTVKTLVPYEDLQPVPE